MRSFATAFDSNISSLYRYQSFNLDRLRCLLEGKLYCASPADFNDPWDCQPFFALRDSPEGLESAVRWFLQNDRKHKVRTEDECAQIEKWLREGGRSRIEQVTRELSVFVKQQIDMNYRLCCLSATNDCSLMWSHYADSHKGVCLEFSTSPVCLSSALKVNYLESYPEGAVSDEDVEMIALATKSRLWSYEQEYRFVSPSYGPSNAEWLLRFELPSTFHVDSQNFLRIPGETVVSIIAGCRMSEVNLIALRALVDRYNRRVEIKKAVLVPGRYDLAIEPV